jgi:uncharacterized protein (TIGR02588 family)
MTYSPQQPYQQPATPQSPAGWTPAPPPRKQASARKVLLITVGVTLGAVALMAGLIALNQLTSPSADSLDVAVTSCEGNSTTATIGFTVTNKGTKDVAVAAVRVEYRDGSGARLDTDTSYVRQIKAGDTVRGEEVTVLDAAPAGTLECGITSVGVDG